MLTVTPLTKNVSHVLPFQVFISPDQFNGLEVESKVQAEQIRALDISRFVRKVGALSTERVAALDAAIKLHLALE